MSVPLTLLLSVIVPAGGLAFLLIRGSGGLASLRSSRTLNYRHVTALMAGLTSAGSICGRGRRKFAMLAVLSGLLLTTLSAQRYSFKSYLREQGLTNLVVMALLQDGTGFVWTGTQNGLFRYDGERFERYGVGEGLPSSRIYSLHESSDRTLWVGTEGGLARKVGDRFELVDGFSEFGAVFDIDSTLSNVVYAATRRGLLRAVWQHDDSGGTSVAISSAGLATPGRVVHAVHVAPSGVVWFACGQSICASDSDVPRIWTDPDGIPGARWDDIVTGRDGALWVRSARHLRVLRPGEARFVSQERGLPSISLYGRILSRRNGQIVIPTDRGVAFQEEDGWRLVSEEHGLPASAISSVIEDHEESLWIGTRGSGVARWLGEERWRHWTESEGLTSNSIRAIERSAKHGLWVGTDDGLNLLVPGGGVRRWTQEDGLAGNAVRSLAVAQDDALWIGSYPGGITRLDPDTGELRFFGGASGLENDRPIGVHVDGEGQLWVATIRGLYRAARSDRFARFEKQRIPGLDADMRYSRALTTRDGALWVASHAGLLRYQGGQWTRWTTADGLKSDAVLYLTEGPDGSIWIGYIEALGTSRVRVDGRTSRIEHLGAGQGPSSDKVLFLGFDQRGRFWYGSDSGVDVNEHGTWRHYTREDGLVWDSCNGHAFLAESDRVWIGTSRGLSSFRPDRGSETVPHPEVLITAAHLGDKRIDPAARVPATAPYRDRALSVEFTALSFQRERDIRFRCRLLGWEDDWVAVEQRQARYSGLSPGSYSLEIQAYDIARDWTSASTRLAFEIEPPWWGTWWFRVVALLVLVFSGFAFWKMRMGHLENNRLTLEAAVVERTDALRLAKLQAERQSELVEVQKQKIGELLEQTQSASRHKGEFLANMSHEIRTPMNGVIGITGLLADTELSDEQRDYVETIRSSGETLVELINGILDFSKIEDGHLEISKEPFDLRDCLEQALDVVAPIAAEKSLELGYLLEPNPPPRLLGDPGRVRQILVNLLGNAVKFTAEGEIFAAAEVKSIGANLHRVQVSVKDTGIGIPSDQRAGIFESFSQVDASTTRRFGGTGLGLSICKSLCRLMGGDIWLESELGRGSTFHFTITVGAEQATRIEDPANTTGTRVLIVDDNATGRKMLRKLTESWGMVPTEVDSGPAALDLIREGRRFDVGLLDMLMPNMDGVGLASELRRLPESSNMPLILLTSLGSKSSRTSQGESSDSFFQATLTKPIKQSSLYNVLASALDGTKEEARAPRDDTIDTALGERYPSSILVTEDNAVNRKVLLKILQRLGYEADVAVDGYEALEATACKPYDIIFMDVQMPKMDGLEATRRIRREQSDADCPTIIGLTANALKGDREICLQAGMHDYVSKPVCISQVQDLLRRYSKDRHTESPSGAVRSEDSFDQDALRKLALELGDDAAEFVYEFVETFVEETTTSLQSLRLAAKLGDWETLHREAHSLKGSSRYVGALELSRRSAVLEALGTKASGDETTKLIDQLDAEFEKVREDLAQTSISP